MLANRERWCWHLGCTTCATCNFRYAFYEIASDKHPDSSDWRTRGMPAPAHLFPDYREIPSLIGRSERLHQGLADASVAKIAASCTFPDWLGYMGCGLCFTEPLERDSGALTASWAGQLRAFVVPHSPADELLGHILSDPSARLHWRDLGLVERHIDVEG
jgi:hypothetical protein